jgi:hypothetical protein
MKSSALPNALHTLWLIGRRLPTGEKQNCQGLPHGNRDRWTARDNPKLHGVPCPQIVRTRIAPDNSGTQLL